MADFTANLLASARSLDECEIVLGSGASWLDLKEPLRGSLGRPDFELVRHVVGMEIPNHIQVSIAGGEMQEWMDDLAGDLEKEWLAILPERFYIKLALAGLQGSNWASAAQRISQRLRHPMQLILVYYADAIQALAPGWNEILDVSKRLDCKYILVDTHYKKSGGLLDHCSIPQLKRMIDLAKSHGLHIALAGSLQLEQIDTLAHLGAEWLGFRGALCQEDDRTGILCPNRLQLALSLVSNFSRNVS